VSDIWLLRDVFGPERDEVTGEQKKLKIEGPLQVARVRGNNKV
jgi:hypothetical protein